MNGSCGKVYFESAASCKLHKVQLRGNWAEL